MQILDKGFVELQGHFGSDEDVVNAARVSFLGDTKGATKDKALLKYLIENRHLSPLEMVQFKFRIKCPLFVRSQIMRHRMASYNEVSRRYTKEDIEFYTPSVLRLQSPDNKQSSIEEHVTILPAIYSSVRTQTPDDFLESIYEDCFTAYQTLLNFGVCREQARMVLPQSMYTMFIMSIDLRNLLHFLALRTHEHAQWETRQYAIGMESMVKEIVPWTFEFYESNKERFM